MFRFSCRVALCLGTLLAAAPSSPAQQTLTPRIPHIGCLYPAGGQQGASVEVSVAGQYLNGASEVLVSGPGVQATVDEYARPLTPKEVNQLRNKLQEVQKRLQAARKNDGRFGRSFNYQTTFRKMAEEAGVSAEELKALEEYRKQRSDPKRQLNPQLAETVTLRVQLDPDAEPGRRELRLLTASGLSNPLAFYVGRLPEILETEPNDKGAGARVEQSTPMVVNGQILPGDVDRFSFQARRGEHLVIAAAARQLIPYLADAVPGWFQAVATLYDANGKELAFADDFRFHPDPVIYYEIPRTGQYVLEIRDAVYRGREDFVYRVTLGEIPFVTSVFPLGGRDGQPTAVQLAGWNLPVHKTTLVPGSEPFGIGELPRGEEDWLSGRAPLAADTLPERLETEPNDRTTAAQHVQLPLIVNGRIDRPGDQDVFRFEGRAGDEVVAEVLARRLNSPLDSLLQLTDAGGRTLAANDDHEDLGAGLTTHHADSWLRATLPADGAYYLHLSDAQDQGGPETAYRLRIGAPRPDFELRVTPASLVARPGQTVVFTVYALRKDGFAGDIELRLKDAPLGFALGGAWAPAGQDHVPVTLTAPPAPRKEPVRLRLEGRALVQGREVSHEAVPAEDMAQAFIYHHLVPAQEWIVAVSGPGRFRAARPPVIRLGDQPVRLPAGGTAWVRFAARGRPMLGDVRLALREPPEGITLQKTSPVPQGLAALLSADAAKIRPGWKGNLIVDAFLQRSGGGRPGQPSGANRRQPLGALPAIPVEIIKITQPGR